MCVSVIEETCKQSYLLNEDTMHPTQLLIQIFTQTNNSGLELQIMPTLTKIFQNVLYWWHWSSKGTEVLTTMLM